MERRTLASQLRDNPAMLPPPTAEPVDIGLPWSNRFAALGPDFSTALQPTPLPAPYWVGTSPASARLLGLGAEWLTSPEGAALFTGNTPIQGSQPLASVYSGHQFGVWAGQLGDGRAILLGETTTGLEVQLKGAGRTPYSRMGDGRAVLRSSIREFLCSEAMAALGIPTTRALCVTGSDAPVRRETIETAAVVTRLAPSFIRFGHFEHFSARGQHGPLRQLADHVIDHYYPDCRLADKPASHSYAALLQQVSQRTAELLARWQAVGFCHGVMNTDNMSILGLTIDYGPFQFLDGFDPGHICNHSDEQGRYAFNRQPQVAYWNLFCLGQALMPLIEDEDLALAALETYKTTFPAAFDARMRDKLGLLQPGEDDRTLIEATLKLLANERTDYTIFWRRLSHYRAGGSMDQIRDLFVDRRAFDDWMLLFSERHTEENPAHSADLMLNTNPKYVLRNHLGETAIAQAQQKDFSGVQTLQRLLESPYAEHPGFDDFAGFPPDWAAHIAISCSS